jgi:hypothetical protein
MSGRSFLFWQLNTVLLFDQNRNLFCKMLIVKIKKTVLDGQITLWKRTIPQGVWAITSANILNIALFLTEVSPSS